MSPRWKGAWPRKKPGSGARQGCHVDGVAHSDKARRSRVVVLNVQELALEFAHRSRDMRRPHQRVLRGRRGRGNGGAGCPCRFSWRAARMELSRNSRKCAPRPSPDRGAIRGAQEFPVQPTNPPRKRRPRRQRPLPGYPTDLVAVSCQASLQRRW